MEGRHGVTGDARLVREVGGNRVGDLLPCQAGLAMRADRGDNLPLVPALWRCRRTAPTVEQPSVQLVQVNGRERLQRYAPDVGDDVQPQVSSVGTVCALFERRWLLAGKPLVLEELCEGDPLGPD